MLLLEYLDGMHSLQDLDINLHGLVRKRPANSFRDCVPFFDELVYLCMQQIRMHDAAVKLL